jgi:DNA polymerase III subunit gamma/tau
MSKVFYRKYRPQKFSEIIGQENVKQTLENAIKADNLSHAYLFCGPRGTGKTSTARIFAKSIFCQNRKPGSFEPCNKCEFCTEIIEDNFIDLIELDAASNRGIQEIRELKENIKTKPFKGKYKIYILDEAHQLTKEACNALLKILEEPPEYVIFILATTDPEKMIPTILSRVQRFNFQRITLKDIANTLKAICKKENISFEELALKKIAILARGGMRDAESILSQIATINNNITIENVNELTHNVHFSNIQSFIDNMIKKERKNCLGFIYNLDDTGYSLEVFLKNLITYFRKLMLLKESSSLESLFIEENTKEELEIIKTQAKEIDLNLTEIIKELSDMLYKIKKTPFPILSLELFIFKHISCDK